MDREIILGGPLKALEKDAERVRKQLVELAPVGYKREVDFLWKVLFQETLDNVLIAVESLGQIPWRPLPRKGKWGRK